MSISKRLKDFLDENKVKYTIITHSKAYTAQEIASSSHIPGKELAKTVVIKIDGEFALAVLPASDRVSCRQFVDTLGAKSVKLASEDEFRGLFPDCETGAMPPFGNLYNLSTYVASNISDKGNIAFNAGNHVELIKMKFSDYENLVKPTIIHFELD